MEQGLKKEFDKNISLLKIFYSKALEILEVFSSGYMLFADKGLNHYYTALLILIEEILNKKDFTELKNDAPYLYENLMGDFQHIDESREFVIDKCRFFLGKIEKMYIAAGQPDYEITKELKMLLKSTDDAIKNYKNLQEEKNHKFKQDIEGLKEIFEQSNQDNKEAPKNNDTKFESGILYFRGKEIDFNNKPNQKELLDIIFEEPHRDWFYDEMLERWDNLKKLNLIKLPEKYWKKFDTAGDGINQAVAVETTIKDFIKKNSKKIRIDPKYI